MAKLFFIGDSITAGAWDKKGGWANRIMMEVINKTTESLIENIPFYCLPYNLGVSGNTVLDLLARIEREVIFRCSAISNNERIQIIFLIGTNDSKYLTEENNPLFSDEIFKKNLNKLIEVSSKITKNISFIGLPPVDDNLVNPIPWTPTEAYANKYIEHFENMIESVCDDNNLPFHPMFQKWLNLPNYKEYLADGLHPNSKGHRFIEEEVSSFLFTDNFKKFHSGE